MNPAAEYRALKKDIDAALASVLSSGYFIGGTEVEAFEDEWGSFLGAQHVVGVGNGTDALEIALTACGIGRGQRVAVPAFTFAATIEAVVRCGATPQILDVTDSDLTIDVNALGNNLRSGQSIDAVVPVHLYGHPADMDALLRLRQQYGFKIVEDAAQAQGARCQLDGQRTRVGPIGDAGCFSFYPTKNLGAAGDAGAVVTNDREVAARARMIANHGDASKYEHVLRDGRNSRLDAIQAAILRVKLRHLDDWNAARRRLAAVYTRAISDLDLHLPSERAGAESVFHQYAIRIEQRDAMMQALRKRNVASSIHYPRGLHQQPGFADFADPGAAYPVAERAAATVLCLPIHPLSTEKTIAANATALREALAS